ncbi:MAG: tetratricopeptide repeat protein [bacterium]
MTDRRQVLIAIATIALVIAVGVVQVMAGRDADDLFHRAEQLYADQRYDDTLTALRSFPRGNALAAEADVLAGKTCFRLKRFAEAETYFRRAEGKDPGSSRIRMNLALSLYNQGRYDEAATGYSEVMKRAGTADPDLAERASIALRAAEGKRSAN